MQEEIKEQYQELFSVLKTPSKKLVLYNTQDKRNPEHIITSGHLWHLQYSVDKFMLDTDTALCMEVF